MWTVRRPSLPVLQFGEEGELTGVGLWSECFLDILVGGIDIAAERAEAYPHERGGGVAPHPPLIAVLASRLIEVANHGLDGFDAEGC